MSMKFTDGQAEKELDLVHWMRANSTPMWLGVDVDHRIFYTDDRLAHRLGYHGVHTAFLGMDLSTVLSKNIGAHETYSIDYVKSGKPPLPLTRQNTDKFVMVARDGTEHPCFVKVRTMEDNYCKGFCSVDASEKTRIFGMAEITFIDDLPQHIQDAVAWYNQNRGLVDQAKAGGLADFLKTQSKQETGNDG